MFNLSFAYWSSDTLSFAEEDPLVNFFADSLLHQTYKIPLKISWYDHFSWFDRFKPSVDKASIFSNCSSVKSLVYLIMTCFYLFLSYFQSIQTGSNKKCLKKGLTDKQYLESFASIFSVKGVNIQTHNCSGEYIIWSEDIHNAFAVRNSSFWKNLIMSWSPEWNQDMYDFFTWGAWPFPWLLCSYKLWFM